MKKNIKPFIIGAIFGGLIMPVTYLITGTCSMFIPDTYNGTGGYWNISICDFMGFLLVPLFAPALFISNQLAELLSRYFPKRKTMLS